jgi:hypothetical protein
VQIALCASTWGTVIEPIDSVELTSMALEDRVGPSVDKAVDELTACVTTEVRALVEQVLAVASDERETALGAARADAVAARAETAGKVQEAEAHARVREREAFTTAVSRLLESIRLLDSAETLSDVLDALGRGASLETPRAALLVVRHDRLHGWKLTGFGTSDAQPKAIDIALTEHTVAGLAAKTGRPVTTREAGAGALEFAHLPPDRIGVAVPVIVGGRAVAVVYGDQGVEGAVQEARNRGGETIEILARHASRCLEALTVQKTTGVTSPRFWVQTAAARPGVTA